MQFLVLCLFDKNRKQQQQQKLYQWRQQQRLQQRSEHQGHTVYNKPNNSSVKNGSLKIHAPLISLRRDAGRLFSQATTKYNCNILRATNNSNKNVMPKNSTFPVNANQLF